MSETRDSVSSALAARVSAFAGAAALSMAQDITREVLPALSDADRPPDAELVAEETLVLTSVVTARGVEVGLRGSPDALEAAGLALAELPFLYHDFLLGLQLVSEGAEGDQSVDEAVYQRLSRKADFYDTHFPPGRFPGPRALAEKLPLWMGRVSPPGLPTSPDKRLDQLPIGDMLAAHARLVQAFARKASGAG